MKCFIIQPFSQTYQKRYKDVFAPAIIASGLKPYKVDEDPSAAIPIEQIEQEIRSSDVCFADISEDNANVWFELGFALAEGKAVCIVCASQSRARLPFDVQHRKVLFYDSESPSDFVKLGEEITKTLEALVERGRVAQSIATAQVKSSTPNELRDYELTALALISADQLVAEASVSVYGLKTSMSIAGFNDFATALALRELHKRTMIEQFEGFEDGSNFYAVRLTDLGWDALSEAAPKLELRKAKSPSKAIKKNAFSQDLDDEIPF